MAKVKVKVKKTFSTRELAPMDNVLASKMPLAREGDVIMMEEEAYTFARTNYGADTVEKAESGDSETASLNTKVEGEVQMTSSSDEPGGLVEDEETKSNQINPSSTETVTQPSTQEDTSDSGSTSKSSSSKKSSSK